ncbi:Protein of unknown function [Alteribacillus persepolensis]|uniref:4 TMS phage holin, superfamily IV n=1 Tax=Alteribacillus persepolensis TaxID=568899 RepID=A0A1G8EF76_9BACI|nr:DUF2512 family protein [Alteribacillus persepolensis]SDH68536.1 Protein of unknown function [Alteribacillus persepolensis]
MNHVIALVVKTILVMFILVIVLSLMNGYPFLNTLGLSLIVVGTAYIIGDLFILDATNNTVSTIADIGLCTLVIWLIGPFILNEPVSFILALLTAVLIGLGEWFFHKYVVNAVISKNPKVYS